MKSGTSLVVQWLRLYASTAVGMDLIPGQGAKISACMLHGHKIIYIKKETMLCCFLYLSTKVLS